MILVRILIVGTIFALALQACTPSSSPSIPEHLRHLDLESSSSELAALLEAASIPATAESEEVLRLEEMINAGKRNLAWWNYLVKNLPAGKIPPSLSAPTTNGIPMDKALKYNAGTIIAQFEKLRQSMPEDMQQVLFYGADFTTDISIPLEQFIPLTQAMDISYQRALRWKLLAPYLKNMQAWRIYDIRGYYFLSQNINLKQNLESWDQLSAEDQKTLRSWLEIQCYNSMADDAACAAEFTRHLNSGTLWDFHQEKARLSAEVYNQFFNIEYTRPEIVWSKKNPKKMAVPFKTPANAKIREALRFNIQDEWRWKEWQLELNFTPTAAVHIDFKDGVTPNVNGEGGDTITMDSNTPLNSESTKYTLRHEFGHILGFPDCYLEFYDPNENVLISYQIDVTDLMCSRAGKLKERHFLELKKAYFK